MSDYVHKPVESLLGTLAENSLRRSLGLSATIYGVGALSAWAIGSGVAGTKPKSDVMDIVWPAGFTLATWANAIGLKVYDGLTIRQAFENLNYREALVLGIVTAWGGRLAGHLILRGQDHEDPRYANLRARFERQGYSYKWLSSICVFLPQAALQLAISFPWVAAFTKLPAGTLLSDNWNWVDTLGVGLATAGLFVEAGADYQLERFKLDRTNSKTGSQIKKNELFSLSRHPNYLGDILVNAGLFALTSSMTIFNKWLAVGPAVHLLLLTHFSAPVTEKSQEERYSASAAAGNVEAGRKLTELQAYQQDTPSIFPRLCLGNKWLWAVIGAGAGGATVEYAIRTLLRPRNF